jgi:hypothetical protein
MSAGVLSGARVRQWMDFCAAAGGKQPPDADFDCRAPMPASIRPCGLAVLFIACLAARIRDMASAGARKILPKDAQKITLAGGAAWPARRCAPGDSLVPANLCHFFSGAQNNRFLSLCIPDEL